ncbi:MAG: TMEM175 family protein [Betaproteobacteria bacterium]
MLEPVDLPKGRLEAVTDGIFSVTMTLLVLDLRLPGSMPDGAALWTAMVAEIPAFDDYVISFAVLCVFWISHLRLLRRLDSIDTTFTWLNLAFLLCTTFIPVLTAFAGRNPGHPRPAILYAADLIAILACEMLMWRHALPRLVNASVTDAVGAWRAVRRKFAIAIGVVTIGLVLAMLEIRAGWNSGFASYTYLLLIVVGVVHPAVTSTRRPRKAMVSASRE